MQGLGFPFHFYRLLGCYDRQLQSRIRQGGSAQVFMTLNHSKCRALFWFLDILSLNCRFAVTVSRKEFCSFSLMDFFVLKRTFWLDLFVS